MRGVFEDVKGKKLKGVGKKLGKIGIKGKVGGMGGSMVWKDVECNVK
ncbi:hypothetical protein [Staphylococcus aureus]|nr:hypothetical protein [Staphylococcus aureus]